MLCGSERVVCSGVLRVSSFFAGGCVCVRAWANEAMNRDLALDRPAGPMIAPPIDCIKRMRLAIQIAIDNADKWNRREFVEDVPEALVILNLKTGDFAVRSAFPEELYEESLMNSIVSPFTCTANDTWAGHTHTRAGFEVYLGDVLPTERSTRFPVASPGDVRSMTASLALASEFNSLASEFNSGTEGLVFALNGVSMVVFCPEAVRAILGDPGLDAASSANHANFRVLQRHGDSDSRVEILEDYLREVAHLSAFDKHKERQIGLWGVGAVFEGGRWHTVETGDCVPFEGSPVDGLPMVVSERIAPANAKDSEDGAITMDEEEDRTIISRGKRLQRAPPSDIAARMLRATETCIRVLVVSDVTPSAMSLYFAGDKTRPILEPPGTELIAGAVLGGFWTLRVTPRETNPTPSAEAVWADLQSTVGSCRQPYESESRQKWCPTARILSLASGVLGTFNPVCTIVRTKNVCFAMVPSDILTTVLASEPGFLRLVVRAYRFVCDKHRVRLSGSDGSDDFHGALQSFIDDLADLPCFKGTRSIGFWCVARLRWRPTQGIMTDSIDMTLAPDAADRCTASIGQLQILDDPSQWITHPL